MPGKNLRDLGGRPLITWTIDVALASQRLTAVVVSTDSSEIRSIAQTAGAEVPFLRTADLAADTTPTLPVILDALDRLAGSHGEFDAVCLLQPTSPFRSSGLIDDAIDRFFESTADSVISVRRIPTHHHPDWALIPDEDGFARWATGLSEPPSRRQALSAAFHRDGSLYVTRVDVLRSGSLYGSQIIPFEVSDPGVNIDTMEDFERGERIFRELGLG